MNMGKGREEPTRGYQKGKEESRTILSLATNRRSAACLLVVLHWGHQEDASAVLDKLTVDEYRK